MLSQKILIVDDEASIRTALFRALSKKGYSALTAGSVSETMDLCKGAQSINLALVDLRLPDGDGLKLMQQLKSIHPQMKVIILTGFGSIEAAVDATQKGAFHFITKPFNLEEVVSFVDQTLAHQRLETENQQLRSALYTRYRFENIIGRSPEIKKVLELVERVADADSTTLITGASGTGKELIAKAIHYNSARSQHPFVPINCGAIPSELLESELFGHVKGSFTGAVANRIGRFEMANNGTLFFDEIGEMSPHLQVKLLRVLQERKFEPVGSTKTQEANVRIIAATNIDLEKAVERGDFREDLYYRLNVIPIEVPSLKNRASDIPLLLQHFLQKFNLSSGKKITHFSPSVIETLFTYPWPGNIRELENLVERLTILKGEGTIELDDLPPKYRSSTQEVSQDSVIHIPDNGMDFNSAVDSYEIALILQALEKTGWNRNQAAILLKLNRTTLVEKIKKKGLSQEMAKNAEV
ncbi:MAG: sigma-54-dependent Fis family transcriptional regulator [Bdellovibrionales bacterium]|nr:sigma-54-dependent Fis family transcriptional regulator [Bdellovibrionales bacterium]